MKTFSTAISLALLAGCTVSTGTGSSMRGPQGPSYGSSPAAPSVSPVAPVPCIDADARDVTDRFDEAAPPSSGAVYCTSLRDVDLFAIAVPPSGAGSIVRYSVEPMTGEMAPTVEVYNANRKEIAGRHNPRGSALRGWAYAAGGTMFFLKVRSNASKPDSYRLTIESGVLADATEPNGSFEAATPLAVGAPVTGFLARALNDDSVLEDWYRLDVATEGPLTVDVDMSQGVAPRLELFDANRKRIASTAGGRGERIQLAKKIKPGTYYLKLDTSSDLRGAGHDEVPEHLTRAYVITAAR